MGWSLLDVHKCLIRLPLNAWFLNAVEHSVEAIVFTCIYSKVATLLSHTALHVVIYLQYVGKYRNNRVSVNEQCITCTYLKEVVTKNNGYFVHSAIQKLTWDTNEITVAAHYK